MPKCKKCCSSETVKSGKVRGKQRYLCKRCGCHFVEGDEREEAAFFKDLCNLLADLGCNEDWIGAAVNRIGVQAKRWIREAGVTPVEKSGWDVMSRQDLEDMMHRYKPKSSALIAQGRMDGTSVIVIVRSDKITKRRG